MPFVPLLDEPGLHPERDEAKERLLVGAVVRVVEDGPAIQAADAQRPQAAVRVEKLVHRVDRVRGPIGLRRRRGRSGTGARAIASAA